jgi:glyoxalase-like protein
VRIRQVALVAGDLEPAVTAVVSVLDLDVSFRDPGVEEFGLHNAVMPIGSTFLEVVSPIRSGTTAGRFLERRGDSGYMVLLQTAHLDRDRERLTRLGARIVWEIALDDIASIQVHPKDIGGAIVALEQPTPPESWRWGGPDWPNHVRTRVVSRIAGAEIEALDPPAMASRWSAALDAPVIHSSDGSTIALDDGSLRFVAAGSRGEGLSAVTIEASDVQAALARARSQGLSADARSFRACGTRFDLVARQLGALASAVSLLVALGGCYHGPPPGVKGSPTTNSSIPCIENCTSDPWCRSHCQPVGDQPSPPGVMYQR